MKKWIFSIFTFLILFFGAVYFVLERSNTVLPKRNPASLQKTSDLTQLRGEELIFAMKDQVVSYLNTYTSSDQLISIQVGHFYFVDSSNTKLSMCDAFPVMRLTFEAEGVALSGERPSMVVEGDCELQANGSFMVRPLNIPFKNFMSKTPFEGEYQESDVSIKFSNTPDEWPVFWVLKDVTLISKNEGDLLIDRNDISKILGRPFGMSFE